MAIDVHFVLFVGKLFVNVPSRPDDLAMVLTIRARRELQIGDDIVQALGPLYIDQDLLGITIQIYKNSCAVHLRVRHESESIELLWWIVVVSDNTSVIRLCPNICHCFPPWSASLVIP